MPAIYEHVVVVAPEEINRYGHVDNLVFLRWMVDAAVAHSAAQGWDWDRYQQLGSGWVVRRHEIDYFGPALLGDQLVVRTWVADFKRSTSQRRYELRRPGDPKLVSRGATDWAFVDLTSGRPRRVPPELASCFELVHDAPAAGPQPDPE